MIGIRQIRVLVMIALVSILEARAQPNVGASYFAPENELIFKAVFPDGSAREFERSFAGDGNDLLSVGGWSGRMTSEGRVSIGGPGRDGVPESYVYDRGRLVQFIKGDSHVEVAYDEVRTAPPSPYEPLAILEYENAREVAEEYSQRELSGKWVGSGRLAFPYVNPNLNGCLYVEFALFSLALAIVWGTFRGLRMAGLALSVIFMALTVLTGSRGAFLGLMVGGGICGVSRFHELIRSRAFWGVSIAAVVSLICYLVFGGGDMLTRGFSSTGGLDWSNALRVDMWKVAPRMMADAPNGWSFCGSGRAYMSWYMPLSYYCLPGSLMNDHLSVLVSGGWFFRFFYIFIYVLIILGGVGLLFLRRNPLPLAVLSAYSIMIWFNPAYSEWFLWILPLGALYPLVLVVWKANWKPVLKVLLVSWVLASGICAFLYFHGKNAARRGDEIPVKVEGPRVLVNGMAPRIWVVDDGRGALGSTLVAKDIRNYYSVERTAPAMGFVKDFVDLPEKGVERLVLAGKAGNDWLLKLSEDESARRNLPKSVLFISPPFNPSEIPPAVIQFCHPEVIVGEFAARFREEYRGNLPNWVKIIPSMEKYIMLWPSYALGN